MNGIQGASLTMMDCAFVSAVTPAAGVGAFHDAFRFLSTSAFLYCDTLLIGAADANWM